MGTTTPNIGAYIPGRLEANYYASFLAGMNNIDAHDHSGAPNKGVPISSSAIPVATSTTTGVTELCTDAEVIAGTLTDYHVVNPSSLKAKLGVQTLYGVAIGAGTTAAISYTAAGTTGQFLTAVTGGNPVWTTSAFPVTAATGDVIYASAANTYSNLAFVATATRYLSNAGGGATIPAWSQIDLTNGVTGTLPVTNGGLGVASPTDHGVLVGSGATAVTPLTVGTDGQVLVGDSADDPVFATLASANSSITYALGAGTLGLTVTQAGEAQLGGAEICTSVEVLAGTDDTVIVTPNKLTAKLGTQTDHGVALGSGTTAAFSYTSAGTAGQFLTSAGAAADPVWTTTTFTTTSAIGDVIYASANNVYSNLAFVATATRYLSNAGGGATIPAWSQIDLTNGVTGTLPVTNGGLGVASPTDHGILVGSGATAVTPLTVGTDGQVLVGDSADDPVFATLASANSSITYALGAGTLGLTVTQAGEAQLGGAEICTSVEVLAGTDDTVIVTPNKLTAKLGTQTDHGVALGSGTTAAFSYTSAGTAGQFLTSAGAAADPVWTTTTFATTSAIGDVIYASANNVYSNLAFVATATRYLSNAGGGATIPAWSQIDLTNGVTGTLPVTNGGLGVASPTDHGVLVGSGATAVTPLAVGTTGTLLVGATGADPAFGVLAYGSFSFSNLTAATETTFTVNNTVVDATSRANIMVSVPDGGADGYFSWEIQGTRFYSFGPDNSVAGDPLKLTNSSNPSTGDELMVITNAGVITLLNDLDVTEGGTGVGTFTAYSVICAGTTATGDLQNVSGVGTSGQVLKSNGAGALPTWQSDTSGLSWAVVTVDATLVVNSGTVADKAGLLTMTLPATAALFDVIRITGMNTDVGVRVAQNANQQIHYNIKSTTVGVGGYLESTKKRDVLEMICVVEGGSTEWQILSSEGDWTVV